MKYLTDTRFPRWLTTFGWVVWLPAALLMGELFCENAFLTRRGHQMIGFRLVHVYPLFYLFGLLVYLFGLLGLVLCHVWLVLAFIQLIRNRFRSPVVDWVQFATVFLSVLPLYIYQRFFPTWPD